MTVTPTRLMNSWQYHDDYGRLHRDDGPAIINDTGSVEYYRMGRCHRMDGPAIISHSGIRYYFINDQEYEQLWKYCEELFYRGYAKIITVDDSFVIDYKTPKTQRRF